RPFASLRVTLRVRFFGRFPFALLRASASFPQNDNERGFSEVSLIAFTEILFPPQQKNKKEIVVSWKCRATVHG
ncbi:MAG TPA: hypothetical protein ACFYEA_00550, partial [Candidatus Tripitaka californicus]